MQEQALEPSGRPEVAVARLQGRAREAPPRSVLARPSQAILPAVATSGEATASVVARHIEEEEKEEGPARRAADQPGDPTQGLAEELVLAGAAVGPKATRLLAVRPVPGCLLVTEVVPRVLGPRPVPCLQRPGILVGAGDVDLAVRGAHARGEIGGIDRTPPKTHEGGEKRWQRRG